MATGGRDDSLGENGAMQMGTVVPNRIFVGGINGKINEDDLRNLFSKFGNVKATKVLFKKCGEPRGYGFVTFETEQEAQKVLKEVGRLTLKDKRLNIAPAMKKHPYNRAFEQSSMHSAPLVWSYPYGNSVNFPNRESWYYPQQASWPLLWQQFLCMAQQNPYVTPQSGYPNYVYWVAPQDYPYSNAGQVSGSDLSDSSSTDCNESGKNVPRSSTPVPAANEYDRNRSSLKQCHTPGVSRYSVSSIDSQSSYIQPSPSSQMHPVFAKTANGVTVIPYPTPFVMSSPTIVQVRENCSESENVLTELGFLHSPMASGTLTPPPTPMTSISCDFNVNTSMESSRKN